MRYRAREWDEKLRDTPGVGNDLLEKRTANLQTRWTAASTQCKISLDYLVCPAQRECINHPTRLRKNISSGKRSERRRKTSTTGRIYTNGPFRETLLFYVCKFVYTMEWNVFLIAIGRVTKRPIKKLVSFHCVKRTLSCTKTQFWKI